MGQNQAALHGSNTGHDQQPGGQNPGSQAQSNGLNLGPVMNSFLTINNAQMGQPHMGRRQSCGPSAINNQGHVGGHIPPTLNHMASAHQHQGNANQHHLAAGQGPNGNRSGKSSLFATPQSIKAQNPAYNPIGSPRHRSQFYGQSGPAHRVNNMRSMNKRPSNPNYVGMEPHIDSYHLGAGGAAALGGGNINMITQNFLQNIQNQVPAMPCQMSINGSNNTNQIN